MRTSLAAEWRDELLDGAGYAFGRTQQERERKRPEEAARRKYGEPRATWWRVTRLVGLMGIRPCVKVNPESTVRGLRW